MWSRRSYESGRVVPVVLLGVGAWAAVVAVAKLADPTSPLEDTLGLLLGLAYLAVGVRLLQPAGAAS